MNISDIKIFKAKKVGPVLAYANIILDEYFIIRGITLLENERSGRFISMPSRRLRNGEKHFRDVCHPLNNEIRTLLTDAVFEVYDELMEKEK